MTISAQFTFGHVRNVSNTMLEKQQIFRKRWNSCKNTARKLLIRESCVQQHLFEHFQSPGHSGFIENVCITFIDGKDLFIPAFTCSGSPGPEYRSIEPCSAVAGLSLSGKC